MGTYKCSICQEYKSADNFYVWEKTGYRRQECTNCKRLKMLKYRQENREHTNKTAHDCHVRARRERPGDRMFHSAKHRSKKNCIPFNLEKSDMIIPEFCPVLGIKLTINIGGTTGLDNSPSLDRIVAELGYVKGNVKIISKKANTIKSFGTIEEHQKIIKYMKKCEKERIDTICKTAPME